MGISSQSQGKPFEEWVDRDKDLWHTQLQKDVGPLLGVGLRYMPSEDCFFVRPDGGQSPYLADLTPKNIIYSAVLFARTPEEILGERVEARIYARPITGLGWCLTVSLYWSNGMFGDSQREDFHVLCDIPLVAAQDWADKVQDGMRGLGFKVDFHEPLHGSHVDEFGEQAYYPDRLSYEKAGVTLYVR